MDPSRYINFHAEDSYLRILDQTGLPTKEAYIECKSVEDIYSAIKEMKVRGAPAIGICAAYGLVISARKAASDASFESSSASLGSLLSAVKSSKDFLDESRPTAINLKGSTSIVVDRLSSAVDSGTVKTLKEAEDFILETAKTIHQEDIKANRRLGEYGVEFIKKHMETHGKISSSPVINLIHHCNTGHLATAGHGTALGVIYSLREAGYDVHVFVDETRPRLQGAKLTCYELQKEGIPHTLIVDGASGSLMLDKKVDFVVFGADRLLPNGDLYNKIGTFNLSLAAAANGVPVLGCVPTTTIDDSENPKVTIEERDPREVSQIASSPDQVYQICIPGTKIFNPAFDVTPAKYLSAIITEKGILLPPLPQSIEVLLKTLKTS